MKKALFLDRDGVINDNLNGYTNKISEFVFIDGIFDLCREAKRLDYEIIVVTNQGGIAHGYFGKYELNILHMWMVDRFADNGVRLTDVYYCPHHPHGSKHNAYTKECNCRKPKPGMLLSAADQHNIDLSQSIIVGDNTTDIQAGINAGLKINVLYNKCTSKNRLKNDSYIVYNSLSDIKELL